VFHKSRLVRINVAHALASLGADDDVQRSLAQLVHDDPSPHVRIAAARGLARVGGAKAAAALKGAADNDADAEVKAAAKSAPPPIPPRDEWRTYPVVDPSADDAPVRQEQYFIHTPDGVVWATSTDARGHITTEHVPREEGTKQAGSHESEY
jgi:hypothetical protein